ncbi:hypothetical protein A6E12_08300 [Aliivibrio fischeri]|uniref:hypothetical protein n=1 Tax=Aliivibrio fischeri TaxID=668 RepID=UPI00080DF6D1|nr:hypothetical protein [Aliivibrio fischeri]OCH29007.1 hypothetical protein A6E12_08300 [Aliivibrio fischeri]
MDQVINYLNDNSGAFTVIFTAIVTLSTVIYAVLTGLLVVETKRMRQVQTEPKIQIILDSLDISINITRLKIQNIGYGPAINLSFKSSVVSGAESAEELLKEFTESNFFNTGLRYFGPNQMIHSSYTDSSINFEEKIKSVLSFDLSYESATGKKYKETVIIDMSELKSDYRLGKPHLYSIAQSLDKIQTDIHHLSTGFKRIKVDSFTSHDRKAAIEAAKKQHEEMKQQRK